MIKSLFTRRWQIYFKFILVMVAAVFYFGYLFKASMNAMQHVNNVKVAKRADLPNELLARRESTSTEQPASKKPLRSTTSTLNPIYEYSEDMHDSTLREMKERNSNLRRACESNGLSGKLNVSSNEMFISSGHNLIWCPIFKAASSTWMFYFNLLAGYNPTYLKKTIKQPIDLARQAFPRPTYEELLEQMQTSLSFLIVREPFERILSAYRDKLEGFRLLYYKDLARRIVKEHRTNEDKLLMPNRGPTFKEFIQFLITENRRNKKFNEHWIPIYKFCTPCTLNYTYIAKTDNLDRDSDFIIRQAGLEEILLSKIMTNHLIINKSNMKTNFVIERYFAELTRPMLNELLEIYRPDFELFGYNYTKYFDLIEQPF